MRQRTFVFLLVGGLMGLSASSALAQSDDEIETKRLGQTGMKFLNVSVDARSAAMSDAISAADEGTAFSLFYNPAAMALMEGDVSVGLGRVQWIGGIDHHAGSIALKPFGGTYGVVGVSVQAVDYGDVLSTVRADNDKGYEDVGTVSPSGFVVGLGYARMLSDRFSVGGQLKYARQSLGSSVVTFSNGDASPREEHQEATVAADFGVLYRTGFRSLTFAVNVRNFSREVTYSEDSFELPLTMRIGFSVNVMDLTRTASDIHSLLLHVDAERPRDYSEQVKAGLEYVFRDILELRAGYVAPADEQGLSLGAGLNAPVEDFDLGIDYAYTQFGLFGNVNRIALNFGF